MARPLRKPSTPTTAGAPTSRAGSAPATASASTPSPSTPVPVTCLSGVGHVEVPSMPCHWFEACCRTTVPPPEGSTPSGPPRPGSSGSDSYLYRYNHQRPHEALGQTPPADHYHPSPRPYPRTVASPVYDAGVTVRRVRTNGEIKWGGGHLYLSEALIGEPVGLVQRDDRYWSLAIGRWTPTEGVSCTPPSRCYPCDRYLCARSHRGGSRGSLAVRCLDEVGHPLADHERCDVRVGVRYRWHD